LDHSSISERVTVSQESVYNHEGGPYDAIYFSASFMLLPEPERALRHCCTLLKPGGRIHFTQTIQYSHSRVMEAFKPMLRRLTSIDFGRVTYEADFRAQIEAAGLELETFTVLETHGNRASCLATAAPA
ncbi:MAG: methyltransferase domain-containing protein, partial [Halospina sp.]